MTYKDCLHTGDHKKSTTEYPINERCGHPKAGTKACPNLKASKSTQLGSSRTLKTCPHCAFDKAQKKKGAK